MQYGSPNRPFEVTFHLQRVELGSCQGPSHCQVLQMQWEDDSVSDLREFLI